jgi:hypothetical protein
VSIWGFNRGLNLLINIRTPFSIAIWVTIGHQSLHKVASVR